MYLLGNTGGICYQENMGDESQDWAIKLEKTMLCAIHEEHKIKARCHMFTVVNQFYKNRTF